MSGIMQMIMSPMSVVAGGDSFVFNATISSNTPNYNVKAAAIAAGWNQTSALNATITINSGIYVYSTSTATPAFATGSSFPAGTAISLTNNGLIVGKGGAGGAGGGPGGPSIGNGGVGQPGGLALQVSYITTITNNGTIGGGGGGGGGGAGYSAGYGYEDGGGGGGGRSGGAGGGSYSGYYPGAAGTLSAPGAGNKSPSGDGGNGGGLGQPGASGTRYLTYNTAGSGGAAGSAVSGNSNITWNVTGTRLGAIA